MRFEFKSSFDRSVKSFQGKGKDEIKQVAHQAIDILSHAEVVHQGVGLKHMNDNFWEVRDGLKTRILFRWEGDLVQFILAGDHNDIKRHLA